jgi:hypothetical protein
MSKVSELSGMTNQFVDASVGTGLYVVVVGTSPQSSTRVLRRR